jgi:hypothetical protein
MTYSGPRPSPGRKAARMRSMKNWLWLLPLTSRHRLTHTSGSGYCNVK